MQQKMCWVCCTYYLKHREHLLLFSRFFLFLVFFLLQFCLVDGFLEAFQVVGGGLLGGRFFCMQLLGWKIKINCIFHPSFFSWNTLCISISLKLNSGFTIFLSTTSKLGLLCHSRANPACERGYCIMLSTLQTSLPWKYILLSAV